MKFATAAMIVLASTVGAGAQEREAIPPSRIVPPVLSTRLPYTLPPPPPTSPFAARPDTYAPRHDPVPRVYGGVGLGVPIYDNAAGVVTAAPPPERKIEPPPSAAPEPLKAAERVPEPPKPEPKIVALHGPDTFFVIPGCYAGNLPPKPERLPKGCDLAKLKTTAIR